MSKLYWYIHQDVLGMPTQIFSYPQHSKTTVAICPQTKALDKRVIEILAPYDLLVHRTEDGSFSFESYDVNYQNLTNIKPVIMTKPPSDNGGDENLHISMPYVFLSDDKDLVGYQMAPNTNTKHNFDTCTYVEGTMPVGKYGRILDLAINISKPGILQIVKGEPLWRFVFNKDVELVHIDPTHKIEKYVASISHITNYTKGVKDIFKRAAITYPYKELYKCEVLK